MYYTASQHTDFPLRAYRAPGDPGYVWFGATGHFSISVSPEEAEALIVELRRELDAMKAEAAALANVGGAK